MAAGKGILLPDGSVRLRKTFHRNKGKGNAVNFLRIDTRILKQAHVAPGDYCTITVRRVITYG